MKPDNQISKDSEKKSRKLIGWLVSYQNSDRGSYYEIREGRSFIANGGVTGERIIAIDDATLSNPHTVIQASSDFRLELQDVFTKAGTFIRKSGASQETALHGGPTELEHGDWVRIGEQTKFQVCLINGGSK